MLSPFLFTKIPSILAVLASVLVYIGVVGSFSTMLEKKGGIFLSQHTRFGIAVANNRDAPRKLCVVCFPLHISRTRLFKLQSMDFSIFRISIVESLVDLTEFNWPS